MMRKTIRRCVAGPSFRKCDRLIALATNLPRTSEHSLHKNFEAVNTTHIVDGFGNCYLGLVVEIASKLCALRRHDPHVQVLQTLMQSESLICEPASYDDAVR